MRLDLLHNAARSGVQAGWAILVVTIFTGLLPRSPEATFLTGWTIVTALVSASRIAAGAIWRRDHPSSDAAGTSVDRSAIPPSVQRRWEVRHTAIALASGLAWASLTLVAGSGTPKVMLVGFALTMALVLAGSFHASNRIAHAAFAAPVIAAQASTSSGSAPITPSSASHGSDSSRSST